MAILFYTVLTTLLTFCYSHTSQRKLYVNIDTQLNRRDSLPVVARAAVLILASEEGRKFSECRMLKSMDEVFREISRFPDYAIKRISKEEMDSLGRRCSQPLETERFFWYKGTKWCGPGNTAENESDLGPLEVDKCCWTHDHCDYIGEGESKYDLKNNSPYTRLNCDCEEAFDKCLQEIASKTEGEDKKAALIIRNLYFEIHNPKCFRLHCPYGSSGRSDDCPVKRGIWMNNYKEW